MLVTFVVAYFWVKSKYNGEFVREQIVAQSDSIGGRLEADGVKWIAFPARLRVGTIRLFYEDTQVAELTNTVVQLRNLPGKVMSYRQSRVIEIDYIGIEDGWIRATWLSEKDDTDFSLAVTSTSDSSDGEAVRFTVLEGLVKNLAVHWEVTATEYIELDGFRAEVPNVEYLSKGWAGGGGAPVETSKVRLTGIRATRDTDRGENADFVEVGGVLVLTDATDLDLTATFDLPIANLRTMVPPDYRDDIGTGGYVEGDAHISGTAKRTLVTGHALARDGAFAGEALAHVTVDYDYAPERVKLSGGSVRYTGGGGDFNGTFELEGTTSYELTADVTGFPLRNIGKRYVDEEQVAWLPERASGRIVLSARDAEKPPDRVQLVSGEMKGLDRSVWPAIVPDPVAVETELTMSETEIDFTSLRAVGDGLVVNVSGRAPMDETGPMSLAVRFNHTNPTPMLRAYEQEDLAIDMLFGSAQVSGSLERLFVEGEATARGAVYSTVPKVDVSSAFRLNHTTLTLTDGLAEFAEGTAHFDGTIEIFDDELEPLETQIVDLTIVAESLDAYAWSKEIAQGQIALRTRVQGPIDKLSGSGTASSERIRVGTTDLDEVAATFRFLPSSGALKLDSVRARTGEGTVNATGTIDIETLDYDVDVVARGIRVAAVVGLADVELDLPQDSILDRVRADVVGNLQEAAFDVALGGRLGDATAQGTYWLETEQIEFRTTANVSLPEVAKMAELENQIRGTGVLQLSGKGTLPYPDLTGALRLSDLRFDGTKVGTGAANLNVRTDPDQDAWIVDGDLMGWGTARGVMWRGEKLLGEGDLDFTNVPLHQVLPQYGDEEFLLTASGRLSGRYEQDAGLVSGVGRITDLVTGFRNEDDRIKLIQPFTASYDGEVVTLGEFRLEGPRGALVGGGDIPLIDGQELDFYARGEVRLSILPYLSEKIASSSGLLALDTHVTGTVETPLITGELDLPEPARVRVASLTRAIEIQRGKITATRGDITIQELAGRIGDGVVDVSGRLKLNGFDFEDYDLVVRGLQVPVEATDIAARVNALVGIEKGRRGPRIAGRVDLIEGRYRRKFELRDFNFVALDTSVPSEPPADWMNDIEIGLAVVATEPVTVQVDAGTFAMDLGLTADVLVTGTAANPQLDGRLTGRRGTIKFPKAELDVVRATVDFAPVQLGQAAEVELLAEGDVLAYNISSGSAQQSYLTTVALEGTLDEMALSLSSDPSLTPVEILSLLISGLVDPRDVLASGQASSDRVLSDGANAALAFAGAQLTAPLTQFLTEQLESLLNVRLQIGADLTTGGVRLTARQNLSERLSFEQAFQQLDLETQRTLQEYKGTLYLNDKILIEGVGSNDGTEQEFKFRGKIKYRVFGED